MRIHRSFTSPTHLTACVAALFIGIGLSNSEAARPRNLGSGLDKVLDLYQKNPSAFVQKARASKWFTADDQGRVVVNVHLDGTLPLAKVRLAAEKLGASSVAELASYRNGVISLFVPISKVEALATAPGVSSVILSPRPYNNVGSTTAQGAVVHHTDQVNTPGVVTPAGIKGTGISIGILSDSYNKARGVSTAADGVASGDLPGPGNPNNTQPVVVLKEIPFPYSLTATDEGRGMAEIIHDLAPKAKLAFATAYPTEVAFANNIRSLRTSSNTRCDVIVDDVGYATEPMFSDGIIAQAVDDVATSTSLPGKKVAYFSSAGNAGANGYSATFKLVTWQKAKTLTNQNLKFKGISKTYWEGGFHDFDPSSNIDVSQTITPSGAETSTCFQWDDPFDVNNGITTDYNILVFDVAGNYLPDLSMVTDNFSTNQPVEWPLALQDGVTYQIVICRGKKGAQTASLLRYVERGASLSGEYLVTSAPTTFGHNSAANGNGVAAYVYDGNPSAPDFVPTIEGFTSNGPVVIAFNANGTRLPSPVTRSKPDFAAADGQDTSFFPKGDLSLTDYDASGFPNFFGTSAAAPTAAAIAALVLETAGGPSSLTPAQVSSLLKGSITGTRDIDPRYSIATVTSGATTVTITANGDDPFDANFFRVSFTAPVDQFLTGLELDVAPAGLEFDPDPDTGFPFTVGTQTGLTLIGATSQFTDTTTSGGFQTLTLGLTSGDYASGDSLGFGVDRDTANVGSSGNSADLLESATVQATVTNLGVLNATFVNTFGSGYNYADGLGFIDALKACQDTLP